MRPTLALATLLAACGPYPASGADTARTSSTVPPACQAEVFLTHGEGGCLGSDTAYDFKADLAGCAGTAAVNLWRTDGTPWDEQHPMSLSAEGADGVWQAWIGGPLAHATAAWVPGESTAFDCQADAGKVTMAVRVLDANGVLRDCGVWGHDPASIVAGNGSTLNSDPPDGFATCQIEAW